MRIVFDICKICGTQFTKTGQRHKYCSNACIYKSRLNYLEGWIKQNPELMLLNRARYRARRKKLEFNLDKEDIKIPEVCPILGIPIQANKGKTGWFDNSVSLDRIDPTKGYTKDNIRVISNRANRLKCDATLEELEKITLDARLHRY